MLLRKCCSIIFILLLLTGCLEKEIVDDINIESVEGFDHVEGDDVMGTFVIPIYQADKSISNETFSAVANMNKDLLRELQKKSSAPIVNGSLELVLFNKELAEKGIIKLIDALQRDSSIGTGLYLSIVDGQVKEILEGNFGTEGTGRYLSGLIKHNIERRDVPTTNLHIFLSDYYQEGVDPNLPLLKLVDDKVMITGVVVMKEGKLSVIVPNKQLFYFKFLVDEHTDGATAIKLPDKEEYVSLRSIKTKRDIKVKWKNGEPEFHVHLKMDGLIREYSGGKVDPKKLKEFQKVFEEDLIRQSTELIATFQKEKVDPIGFGYEAKSRKRGFDLKKWEEQYPNVKIKVTSKVRIIGTGITE
ncbi:Ger(x)C family spore germination protein [Bacillus tianshenii]|uniref:Ger(x)C family spore germination protein n=1 Tax=Sutcliffiella tianshenii TaxID=1463404 RepID=UPI001CD339CA|nr:Ger(x)C family spore germination protein [Bacillus tianshenii]MCA1319225.1 Ger(x)C family spore germination protein [Bacillus tianshenii]